jgi:hypothetical protein
LASNLLLTDQHSVGIGRKYFLHHLGKIPLEWRTARGSHCTKEVLHIEGVDWVGSIQREARRLDCVRTCSDMGCVGYELSELCADV